MSVELSQREAAHYPSSSLSACFSNFFLIFGGTFLILRLSLSFSVISATDSRTSSGVSKYLVSSGCGGPSGSLSRSVAVEA